MSQSTILKPLKSENIRIVLAGIDHAESFVRLQNALAAESHFLMLEPEEINSVDRQRQMLADFTKPDSPAKILFAFYDDQMIGYLGYRSVGLKKIQHTVRDIAIGVLEKFQRLGAAQKLFLQAEQQWISAGKKVARLSVMEHNTKAFTLYKKLGFEIEGIENQSLCIQGEFINQKLLWKPLQKNVSG